MNSILITQLHHPDNQPKQEPNAIHPNTQYGSIPNNKNFLNYLIQENTHFANFEKIEAHYLDLVYKKVHQYNSNKLLLKKKQEEYAFLLQEIQSEISSNLCISNTTLLDQYTALIDSTCQEIKVKGHDLDCYTKMYARLYKANYLVRKRFDDEGKFVPVNMKQYEKYVLIKNHAVITMTNQTTALNDLMSVLEISTMKYARETAERTKVFNQLEFEVLMIKKDSANVESMLQGIQKRKTDVKNELCLRNRDNDNKTECNFTAKVEYDKYHKQLLDIFSQLKVKDIGSTIGKFNLLNKEHYDLSSRFDHSNKEIVRLNNELTRLTQELAQMKKGIDLKRHEELNWIGKGSTQGANSEELHTKVKEIKFSFMKLQSGYKDKENYIKIIFVFMLNYMQLIADSLYISAFPNHFSLCKSIESYQKFLTINKDNIHLSLSSLILNKQFINLSFSIFNEFIAHLFTLLSSALNLVCIELYINFASLKRKRIVYDLFSGVVFQSLEEQISNAIIRQENKRHILGRSDKEIFEEKEMNIIKNDPDDLGRKKNLEITDNALYWNYRNFLLKRSDYPSVSSRKKDVVMPLGLRTTALKNRSCEIEYLKLFPNRSMSIMNKYTNDSVIKSHRLIRKKIPMTTTKRSQIELFSRIEPEYAYEIERNSNENDKDFSFIDIDKPYSKSKNGSIPKKLLSRISSNSIKTISTNTNSTNRLKSFNQTGNDLKDCKEEINRIYTRLNDIRKLEYFYFKTHDKSLIENHVLNEIYFKYKRKNLTSYSKLNKSRGSLFQTKPSMGLNRNSLRLELQHFNPSSIKGEGVGGGRKDNSSFRTNQSKALGKSQSTKSVTIDSFVHC